MISKIKRTLAISLASFLLALGSMSAVAFAQSNNNERDADIQNSACQGSDLKFSSSSDDAFDCSDANDSEDDVNNLIADVINIFSVIVGIVAVIMIIYGGFRYITSGGDSSKITDAKNTILYAIIGLVIVAFAQFIVKFVLAKATGSQSD